MLFKQYYNPQTAYIVRGLLDSHGINSYVYDEHINTTAYHLQFGVGGVRLMVHENDLKMAQNIIAQIERNTHKINKTTHTTKSSPLRVLISVILTFVSGIPTPLQKKKK